MTESSRATPAAAILLLACAAFASSTSLRVCDPLLPELARSFGVSAGQAAYTISAFALAYGLCQVFYGPLGDHYGKFRVIALATLASVLGSLGAALAPSLRWLVLARVLVGMTTAAIIPLAMAWIGDQVAYEQRQAVLARFLSGQIIGVIGGQFFGGFFADTLGWRWSFVFIAATYLAVGIALLAYARREARPAAAQARPPFFPQLAAVLRVGWARVILATVFVEGLAVFGALAFVPTYLHQRFGVSLTAAGLILSAYGVGGLAYASVARRMVARMGERGLAAGGGLWLAVGFALLVAGNGWGWGVLSSFLCGLGFYMLHNTLQTHATQMAPQMRGSAVSLFASSLFLGQFAGVALASVLVDAAGIGWMFGLSALVLMVVGLSFARVLQRHPLRR